MGTFVVKEELFFCQCQEISSVWEERSIFEGRCFGAVERLDVSPRQRLSGTMAKADSVPDVGGQR